ncbi:MAG: hypothetical protein MUP73_03205, partial [Dehalococcoidia bacterium]|nr:hypothetical protein [Dehalococcoidia bacterium]
MGKARNVLISLVSSWRACMKWEVALYCLLLVVAFVMRLWDVGARAFHYDEVLHTYYSWTFAQGN